MDLVQRLRHATDELHRRLETLPLAQAMAEGTISRGAYVRLLMHMAPLHDALERELPRHACTTAVYQPAMERLPALHRDLAFFGATTRAEAVLPVRHLTRQMAEWAQVSPWALLGCLYVLEGSRMGSMMLVRPLAAALGTTSAPGQGLDYHADGMAERPRTWTATKAAFNRLDLLPAQQDTVVQAAVATMTALYELYAWVGGEVMVPRPTAAPTTPETTLVLAGVAG